MTPIKLVTPISGDPDAATQNLLGLRALAAELAVEGISVGDLFAQTGADPSQLEQAHARISHRQRLAIYQNAKRLAKRADIGLLAGARQRISDYGIYGYAMVSSRTFGEALLFSLDHVTMAGPAVRQISFRIEESATAILRSHGVDPLGDLLPFAAEFWRSSMTALFGRVLELPFPSKRMIFPFAAPVHWRNYERMFNCPIDFDADRMEWHFDARVLELPCPNANPITAEICQQVCDMMTERPGESDLARKIRTTCLNRPNRFPTAAEIASELGLSLRSFHRHLAEDGLSYQTIVDEMRRSLATELLQNTHMSVDQIAERVGFADATSFRKAFKKWTSCSPTDFRNGERSRGLRHERTFLTPQEAARP